MELIVQKEKDFANVAKKLIAYIKLISATSTFKSYIELQGDLGAGKTTLVRYILRELGFNGKVKSPTYNFLESYDIEKFLNYSFIQHFDLYRFINDNMWFEQGFDEYLNLNNLVFIEWASLAYNCLPKPIIKISIAFGENNTRIVKW
jgi:tRNA threonylcarbamoyladenosine biosynthesis protein TsaE